MASKTPTPPTRQPESQKVEATTADIAACIVGGELIERSKDALDKIYMLGSPDSDRVIDALEVYGSDKLSEEFKYCVDEILKSVTSSSKQSLNHKYTEAMRRQALRSP